MDCGLHNRQITITRRHGQFHHFITIITTNRLLYCLIQLSKLMDERVSMDVQRISAHKLIVAISSHKK